MSDVDKLIQGLWIGDHLSIMEQLSISSFLNNGHEYNLYTYAPIDNVPSGVTILDGNDILPASEIFLYKHHNSYAGFANYFRYKLLFERGGWWSDTDVICLKPFKFSAEHVLATERDIQGREFITNGIIRAPKGSTLMQKAWSICQLKDKDNIRWGETGPILLHNLSLRLSFCNYAQPADVFCPIDPAKWIESILPDAKCNIGNQTHSVHLWNEMWRRNGANKDNTYAPNSLYERLKLIHLRSKYVRLI